MKMNKLFLKSNSFWIISLSSLLLLPYIFISFYNHPSVDDYFFTYKTETLGFWVAQYDWFTTWTGRYFSTFFLSLHPLWLEIPFLYKLIPILLLILTVHSIFRFFKIVFAIDNTVHAFVMACLISFLYLNEMPSLVQGIYWEPGAITYHLANIFLLYLTTNTLNYLFNLSIQRKWHFINIFLIIAICGSNETSMLVVVSLLFAIVGYVFIFKKKINTTLLLYLFVAIGSSLIVYYAPGNQIRNMDFVNSGSHDLFQTLSLSFITSIKNSFYWTLSLPNIVITFFIAFYFLIYPIQVKISRFIYIFFVGFLLITSNYIAGYWSIGNIAPDRTINVAYWSFVLIWISCIIMLISIVNLKIDLVKKIKFNHLTGSIIILLLGSTTFGYSNYKIVINDLISGKAYLYDKEFKKRDVQLFSCKEDICSTPTFSAYPSTIFNEEIGTGIRYNNNEIYAHYYNKKGVRLEFIPPKFSDTYFFNLESADNELLENLHTLTSENSNSPPHSSLITAESSYSKILSKKNKDLKTKNISKIYVKAAIFATDSIVDFVIVLSVTDKNNNAIYWSGREIVRNRYSMKNWMKEEYIFSLTQQILHPENQYNVYIWNRNNTNIYIDDLVISFF